MPGDRPRSPADNPPGRAPNPRPTRYAGVDHGTRRIGLALADYGGRIATPVEALPASGNDADDARRLADWAARHEVTAIVLGLPLNMDGTESAQSHVVRRFADAVRTVGLAVEFWDERLSSYQASAILASLAEPAGQGSTSAGDPQRGRQGRRGARSSGKRARGSPSASGAKGDPRRDAVAAAVILQSYLDARRRDDAGRTPAADR